MEHIHSSWNSDRIAASLLNKSRKTPGKRETPLIAVFKGKDLKVVTGRGRFGSPRTIGTPSPRPAVWTVGSGWFSRTGRSSPMVTTPPTERSARCARRRGDEGGISQGNMLMSPRRSFEHGEQEESRMCNYMAVIACLGFQDDIAAVAANDILGRDLQDAAL